MGWVACQALILDLYRSLNRTELAIAGMTVLSAVAEACVATLEADSLALSERGYNEELRNDIGAVLVV